MKNHIIYKGNINNTSVIIFLMELLVLFWWLFFPSAKFTFLEGFHILKCPMSWRWLVSLIDVNRKEWFCSKDVCKILGHENSKDALQKQVKQAYKTNLKSLQLAENYLENSALYHARPSQFKWKETIGRGECQIILHLQRMKSRLYFKSWSFGISRNRKFTQQNSQRWYLLGRTSRKFL